MDIRTCRRRHQGRHRSVVGLEGHERTGSVRHGRHHSPANHDERGSRARTARHHALFNPDVTYGVVTDGKFGPFGDADFFNAYTGEPVATPEG